MPLSLLFAMAVIALIIARAASQHRKAPYFYSAFDVSGSTMAARERYFSIADAITVGFPSRTTYSLWRFDQTASQLFEGQVNNSRELWGLQDRELKRTTPERGTYPERLLAAISEDLQRRGERRTGLIVFTDGENSGRSLQSIVAALATDERIRAVWLIGIVPEFRQQANRDYEAFGYRLIVSGLDDVSSGLARFQQLIDSEKN